LLTLTGVGGAGKTRLALQAAAAALPAYPDGVWMVELAPLRDGTQAPTAVAAALTFETSAFDTPKAMEDRLIRHLATRQTLLLMDKLRASHRGGRPSRPRLADPMPRCHRAGHQP
jgi:predicted ATPase